MAYLDFYDDVKPIFDIPTIQVDKAELFIASACSRVEKFTRRQIEEKTISKTFQDSLSFQRSAHVAGNWYDFGIYPIQTATVNTIAVQVFDETYVQIDNPVFPLTVALAVGYDTVPADLKQATLEIFKYNWNRFASGQFGTRTVGLENVQLVYDFEIPLSARNVLEEYRMPLC